MVSVVRRGLGMWVGFGVVECGRSSGVGNVGVLGSGVLNLGDGVSGWFNTIPSMGSGVGNVGEQLAGLFSAGPGGPSVFNLGLGNQGGLNLGHANVGDFNLGGGNVGDHNVGGPMWVMPMWGWATLGITMWVAATSVM
ncbi:pentapeptide repeats family protein [Mycobacterium kansasii 732]|nr:pentapeptide repeats family protein [Mycobacterium kansasii 732]